MLVISIWRFSVSVIQQSSITRIKRDSKPQFLTVLGLRVICERQRRPLGIAPVPLEVEAVSSGVLPRDNAASKNRGEGWNVRGELFARCVRGALREFSLARVEGAARISLKETFHASAWCVQGANAVTT